MSQLAGAVTGQKLWSSWRAGRGRANLPGDDHHDVERRLNPHSLVFALNSSERSGRMMDMRIDTQSCGSEV